MIQFFNEGGPYMWILLLIALTIIGLSIKKSIDLFAKQTSDKIQLESGINAILFWGFISVIVGFFVHYMGVYEAMRAIAEASDISPAIVSYGYSMALISILTGLAIFGVSAVLWFFFRWRYKVKIAQIK